MLLLSKSCKKNTIFVLANNNEYNNSPEQASEDEAQRQPSSRDIKGFLYWISGLTVMKSTLMISVQTRGLRCRGYLLWAQFTRTRVGLLLLCSLFLLFWVTLVHQYLTYLINGVEYKMTNFFRILYVIVTSVICFRVVLCFTQQQQNMVRLANRVCGQTRNGTQDAGIKVQDEKHLLKRAWITCMGIYTRAQKILFKSQTCIDSHVNQVIVSGVSLKNNLLKGYVSYVSIVNRRPQLITPKNIFKLKYVLS